MFPPLEALEATGCFLESVPKSSWRGVPYDCLVDPAITGRRSDNTR